jgi:hypothetical protein
MMFLMMCRRYQPFPQWTMNNRAREQLPPHVVGDPHQGHDAQHAAQCGDMDGDDENEGRDDQRAGQCLPRVKAHRGPSGWRAAFMMHGMRLFEPIWPVH